MSDPSRPKPFSPHGAVDGIVCDTNLAKKMGFIGRFGNSCGIPFIKDEFCKKHRQYYKFCPYLKDRPTQPWTEFTITNIKSKFKLTKKNKSLNTKTKKNKQKENDNKENEDKEEEESSDKEDKKDKKEKDKEK
jgi:hypothetical protein